MSGDGKWRETEGTSCTASTGSGIAAEKGGTSGDIGKSLADAFFSSEVQGDVASVSTFKEDRVDPSPGHREALGLTAVEGGSESVMTRGQRETRALRECAEALADTKASSSLFHPQ